MKVLFVNSANKKKRISPFILSQADSLIKNGISVELFSLNKGGIWGYVKHTFILKKKLKKDKYDIIHAHYALMGFISSFARRKEKLVVSLMGCDILGSYKSNGGLIWLHQIIVFFTKIYSKYFWDFVILKSLNMASKVFKETKYEIIPNGVDLNLFKPLNKKICRRRISLEEEIKYVLYPTNPERKEKNFNLAESAINIIKRKRKDNIELIIVHNLPHDELVYYYNAVDVCILTSRSEGSPNVIKECMACNLPIVSTDVGDVKELISDTKGCYISEPEPQCFAKYIEDALNFNQKTNGREKIAHLEISVVADKIRMVYESILN